MTNASNILEHCVALPINTSKLLVHINNENITNEDLTFQLDSMMKKAEDGEVKWNCTVCGKTAKGKNWGTARQHMMEHVETHIEGLSYTCNQCGKAIR